MVVPPLPAAAITSEPRDWAYAIASAIGCNAAASPWTNERLMTSAPLSAAHMMPVTRSLSRPSDKPVLGLVVSTRTSRMSTSQAIPAICSALSVTAPINPATKVP